MKVLVISKNTFDTTTLTGVSNIAYSTGTYTITHSGGTASYSATNYHIVILW